MPQEKPWCSVVAVQTKEHYDVIGCQGASKMLFTLVAVVAASLRGCSRLCRVVLTPRKKNWTWLRYLVPSLAYARIQCEQSRALPETFYDDTFTSRRTNSIRRKVTV